MRSLIVAVFAAALLALGQTSEYNGPTPPKADVLYLLHASSLVETEHVEAKQETKKNATLYWVEGASSSARTPLAEPIFIVRVEKLNPNRLELYHFDVKKGRRELELKDRAGKDDPKALHLTVTKLGKDLYRVEAGEELAEGEYSLSPSGSNSVFTFQVY